MAKELERRAKENAEKEKAEAEAKAKAEAEALRAGNKAAKEEEKKVIKDIRRACRDMQKEKFPTMDPEQFQELLLQLTTKDELNEFLAKLTSVSGGAVKDAIQRQMGHCGIAEVIREVELVEEAEEEEVKDSRNVPGGKSNKKGTNAGNKSTLIERFREYHHRRSATI